ncbi:MAG: creatininase family protein, partial [Desulfobacterales bacterium]
RRQFFTEQPEILKLRFDDRNSPLNAIPVDLRIVLLRKLLECSDGALRRSGRRWTQFDPLEDPGIRKPYPFELGSAKSETELARSTPRPFGPGYLWAELTWPDAAERLKEVDIALLPVGAVEQHGPHLPLDTDAFDAEYLSHRVADACSDPKPLVLPTVSYGVSYHHEGFQGTISLSNDTLARLIYDIGISLSRNGIKKMVIINGHGGNSPALNHAAQMINRDAHIFVCVDTGETSDVDIDDLVETPNDVHAGEIETSTSLAVRPHLVKMNQALQSVPEFSSRYLDFTSKRSVLWYAHTRKISKTGVMGDPTKASAAKGRKIWEIMIAHLVAMVEDLKLMTLEEIHHRKY